MTTVLVLKGETHIAIFENTATGRYQLARKRENYPSLFKRKRAKEMSFISLNPDIAYKHIYEIDVFNQLQAKIGKEAKAEKPVKRSNHPMSGDYLQLIQHGRLSEDFTFVHELLANHEDGYYVVLDVMGREYLVQANPDRDNRDRKAFKQVPGKQ